MVINLLKLGMPRHLCGHAVNYLILNYKIIILYFVLIVAFYLNYARALICFYNWPQKSSHLQEIFRLLALFTCIIHSTELYNCMKINSINKKKTDQWKKSLITIARALCLKAGDWMFEKLPKSGRSPAILGDMEGLYSCRSCTNERYSSNYTPDSPIFG